MLSNAYFLAKFRFDTAENEPAKHLQNFRKMHFRKMHFQKMPAHRAAAVVVRVQREDHARALLEVLVHPLDLVRVHVRRAHLNLADAFVLCDRFALAFSKMHFSKMHFRKCIFFRAKLQ